MITFMKPESPEPCVFCRIIKGELPAHKIYEDDEVLAFLDVKPINPGHLLVIPKAHYKTVTDMPKELHGKIYEVVWDLALRVQESLDPDGLKLIQNNNIQAGQVVPHFHVHLIPRFKGDEAYYSEEWTTREVSDEELGDMKKKLTNRKV